MSAAPLKPFVFVATLVALVSLACGIDFGGETPAPAEPPSQAEATNEPAAPGAGQEQYFTDNFDGEPTYWSYFVTKNTDDADDSGAAPRTENGYFLFDIEKNLNVYATYDTFTYDDVRIDVRVENRGVNKNNVNLICRYSDDGWYEVSIFNSGLYKMYAATDAYHLLADGGSNKIKQGKETNEYALVCNDRNLRLFINGVETRTYTDNEYALNEGQVGIGLSSFEQTPVEVAFDWVTVSQP